EELEELYPLGQVVAPRKLEKEEIERMCLSLSRYLEKHGRKYRRIVLLNDRKRWGDRLKEICLNSGLKVEIVET
ncbi:MAG: hypothetical protein QXZ52_03195, partial [Candidatus Hadarchaeales archaeon]